ncbi:MAG TPA: M56 family metallopeptidase [Sphingomicrobium sp.]|nr:M56 family metallopeptidase [Sphingomicrobium sp.]
MEWILSLALKSIIIAGAALLLLRIARYRSAVDRSWIAHLGLAAILLLPLAAIALPALEVAGPSFLARPEAGPSYSDAAIAKPLAIEKEIAPTRARFPVAAEPAPAPAFGSAVWAYAIPAALLVLLTLIALGRLILLKARATVLVEPHWLSALAHAQRRMGFKNGTALLMSDDLPSPISWGLLRPTILLNAAAAESHAQSEAIIAHELAHVANFDWAKLLVARFTVALFWFNPLVWLLAREAHQLREEAADDAVLAADIDDTDYANLLVGVARHECRGLLIGAHGVAPAKNSLARRIRRVLDGALERAPGGWRWTSAVGFFAAGMAVPVAALQVVAPTAATTAESDARPAPRTAAIARVALSPLSAVAPVAPVSPLAPRVVAMNVDRDVDVDVDVDDNDDSPRPVRIHPARTAIDRAIELRAVGASPAYAAAMRAAAPNIRLDHDDLIQLRAVGVTPEYVADLARSGHRNLTADDIVEARAMGISGDYVRGISAAGYGPLPMSKLVELRAMGVTPADVARFRHAGRRLPSIDQMIQVKAMGLNPEDIEPDDSR